MLRLKTARPTGTMVQNPGTPRLGGRKRKNWPVVKANLLSHENLRKTRHVCKLNQVRALLSEGEEGGSTVGLAVTTTVSKISVTVESKIRARL